MTCVRKYSLVYLQPGVNAFYQVCLRRGLVFGDAHRNVGHIEAHIQPQEFVKRGDRLGWGTGGGVGNTLFRTHRRRCNRERRPDNPWMAYEDLGTRRCNGPESVNLTKRFQMGLLESDLRIQWVKNWFNAGVIRGIPKISAFIRHRHAASLTGRRSETTCRSSS